MIITLGVFLFQNAEGLTLTYNDSLEETGVRMYNNKFEKYARNLTAQDMISLINLIKQHNINHEYDVREEIVLKINGTKILVNTMTEDEKVALMRGANEEIEAIYGYLTMEYIDGYVVELKYKTI